MIFLNSSSNWLFISKWSHKNKLKLVAIEQKFNLKYPKNDDYNIKVPAIKASKSSKNLCTIYGNLQSS